MRNITVQFLLAISLLCLVPAEAAFSSQFDYAAEGLVRPETVRQEYGVKPLEKISDLVAKADPQSGIWRRSVAATAFLGKEGAAFLLQRLKPALTAKDYSSKTQAYLDSLSHIEDGRCVDVMLDILETKAAPSFKLSAIYALETQVAKTYWTVVVSIPNGEGGSATGAMTVLPCDSRYTTYSVGLPMQREREPLMKVRARLTTLMSSAVNKDARLLEALASVIAIIDEKDKEMSDLAQQCMEDSKAK